MRIFLTGAQGTGKSTIVKELEKIYPEYTVHDSMSKLFMKGDKFKQFTDDFQKKISLYCLNLYVNERNIICSRSYFDSIAYPLYYNDQSMVDLVRSYKKYMFEDDCIYFYLPIEFEISSSNNELRSIDKNYQTKIDKIIKEEIDRVGDSHVITITGSIQERLDKITDIIDITKNRIDYEL